LALLDHFVECKRSFDSAGLTMADCIMFPSLYLFELVTGQLGVKDVYNKAAKVSRYFAVAKQHTLLGAIYRQSVADVPSG
jgi:glutathione S-transferase